MEAIQSENVVGGETRDTGSAIGRPIGRPPKVIDSQIIAAGQKLVAAGKEVNGSSLRSLTTSGRTRRLEEVWKNHIAEQGIKDATVQPVTDEDLPASVVEKRDAMRVQVSALIDSIAADTWRVADGLAQQRTKVEHDDARRRIAAAETIKALDDANLEAADEKLEAAEDRLEAASFQLSAAQAKNSRLQVLLAALELDGRRAAETAAVTVMDLSARLATAVYEEAGQRVTTAASDATARAALDDAQRARSALFDVQQELSSFRSELEAARTTAADLSARLSAADARVASVTDDLTRERQARERADGAIAGGSCRVPGW